mmetsp:Transcript_23182/g.53117  ORF Transcript_23182/g.53117 Transcript_23182/m.53117 type:complete len:91 (+) Transcript_23182:790-1062(+)
MATAEAREKVTQATFGCTVFRMPGTTLAQMRLDAEHTMKKAARCGSVKPKTSFMKYASGPSLTASAKQSMKAANSSSPVVLLWKREKIEG